MFILQVEGSRILVQAFWGNPFILIKTGMRYFVSKGPINLPKYCVYAEVGQC